MARPRIEVSQAGRVAIVALRGEPDSAVATSMAYALDALLDQCRPVVLDLSQTMVIDSAMIAAVRGTLRSAAAAGAFALVVQRSGPVTRLIELLQVAALVDTYDDIMRAVAAVARAAPDTLLS